MIARSPSCTWSKPATGARSAMTSSGYRPSSTGSSQKRLPSPSMRRSRLGVGRESDAGVDGPEVERDADLALGSLGPHRVHRQAVAEQQVVGGVRRRRGSVPARCVLARGVPEERRAPRLVEGGPVPDPVAERVVHDARRTRRTGSRVPGRPAAGVLERLRQIPVVQREPGRDAGLEQLVHQASVEVQPGRVGRAGARRAGPAARPPRTGTRSGRARPSAHVVAVAVVVVAGDVAGVAVERPARARGRTCPRSTGAPSSAAAPSIW